MKVKKRGCIKQALSFILICALAVIPIPSSGVSIDPEFFDEPDQYDIDIFEYPYNEEFLREDGPKPKEPEGVFKADILEVNKLNSSVVLALERPTVFTYGATGGSDTKATLNGEITKNGGYAISDHGFYWGTSSTNPATKASLGSRAGTGYGKFTRNLTGLTPGTQYYYRAYATNSLGTAYGAIYPFKTLSVPTVTTNAPTGATASSGTLQGNISMNGGVAISDHGFYWGTSSTNPSTKISLGSRSGTGYGDFSRTLTGLSSNTTYYFRAYATNSIGETKGLIRN